MAGAVERLLRAADRFQQAHTFLALPVAVFELSLGVYLTVKGFRPAPIIATDEPVGIPASASAA